MRCTYNTCIRGNIYVKISSTSLKRQAIRSRLQYIRERIDTYFLFRNFIPSLSHFIQRSEAVCKLFTTLFTIYRGPFLQHVAERTRVIFLRENLS